MSHMVAQPTKRRPHSKPRWRGRVPKEALLEALNDTGTAIGAAVRLNVSIAAVYRWIQTYSIESRTVWR